MTQLQRWVKHIRDLGGDDLMNDLAMVRELQRKLQHMEPERQERVSYILEGLEVLIERQDDLGIAQLRSTMVSLLRDS